MINLSFKKLSIKRKLIVTIIGISSFMLLSSLSFFMTSEVISLKKNMLEDLSTLADLVGKNSEGALMFLDKKVAESNLLALKAKPHIISSHLFNSDGELFAQYHRNQTNTGIIFHLKINRLIENKTDGFYYINDHLHLVKQIIFEQDKNLLGFIHIESDRDSYWQRVSEYIYTIIIIISIALLLTLALAYRVQKIFTAPILKLLTSMHDVSTKQNYSTRLKSEYNDEFGKLINGYNNMLVQLEQQQRLTRNYQQDLEMRVEERTSQLESARDEALSASRTKSIFLANMSHEIRTPMNAILGYAQLLQQSNLDKEQLRKLMIIDSSGNHLLSLINDILELSKIEAGSLELSTSDFDLIELLHGVENMFRIRCDQKKLHWEMFCFSNQPVLVHGDQGKLRQILINLIGNACKFTEQGEVLLKIEQVGDNQYKFTVKDTGIGIEEEGLPRIFDAFHQERQGELKGGTGLGLNITQRHIKLLSGDLQVRSKINQGSEFFFTIELLPAKKSLDFNTASTMYTLKADTHLSALVVDDTQDNTDLLSSILTQIGFTVVVAENGQLALDKIEEKCPDIVFMDIRMPVMNGIEAIQQIRKKYSSKQLKCIAVSASGLKHNSQYFMDEGYDLFISKPFRFDAIFHAIKTTLDVELQAVENPKAIEESKPVIPEKISLNLDKEFIQELMQAAEYGQLTELGKLLTRFSEYGEAGKIIANHLELLISTADLDGILDYVENIINE
ncbi:MAG: response regulator [gamma proteobacterium symbiont of Bathyaustriella thionipta]|nr:response regulator [gamma proteobacterium symbiont of Bathyaustriella thionipta]MCU7948718.1 response regulator [gamma proteobacterium symbiont of Bathyaustriella thionipta]MCU7954621.1 response regulator [gamma proteobacterium symbiont of Bathyaustriella thionipta]MCU7955201.1 response regulator [gamma proteobacterium symbiont of Bathyaustriella thionipta]MCU7968251.1 response regulator [gamma proteobacterium symbiont of Bathyaustriella thionipta]